MKNPKEINQLIEETVKELLLKMGFDPEIKIESSNSSENETEVVCNISTNEDSNFLIGQHGQNLQAIQHLARLLTRKKTEEKIKFVIDINSYRREKNDNLIELAKEAASKALQEKRSIIMKPMSNYERRLVHLELSKNEAVVTESIGEGEERKIVVKPSDFI